VQAALALLVREAVELLTGPDLRLVRECAAAPSCSLLSLDRSRAPQPSLVRDGALWEPRDDAQATDAGAAPYRRLAELDARRGGDDHAQLIRRSVRARIRARSAIAGARACRRPRRTAPLARRLGSALCLFSTD
jgi:hypothetical protein